MKQHNDDGIQENIETILIEKGFYPIDNVNMCDVNMSENGVCKYIRAITNKGNPVIIELEKEWIEGDIETYNDDEENSQLMICTSDRKICSSFDGKIVKVKREEIHLPMELDMNVDGIGYCTPDGMCIITRDIDEPYITVRADVPMEKDAENVELSQLSMENSLPIPIIKASTILSNSDLVIDDIKAKSQITIDRYVVANANILDSIKKIEENINVDIKKAKDLYKSWDYKISDTIDSLRKRIAYNEAIVQSEVKNKNEIHIDIDKSDTLKQINDDYLLLNRISIQIADILSYKDKLDALTKTLSSFIEIVDRIE